MSKQCVLISIRPQYCELIANVKKTIEVRKTRPKLETPFKCYIYCTVGGDALCPPHMNSSKWDIHRRGNGTAKGRKMTARERNNSDYRFANGKVIGEFVCDNVTNLFANSRFWLNEKLVEQACLTGNQIRKYANGKESVYGWHISSLHIYDKPKELSELYHYLPDKILDNGDYDCRGGGEIVCMDMPEGGSDCEECPYGGRVYLKRPPESWRYVEELEEPCKTKN